MTSDFHDIFAGQRMGRLEERDDHFVEDFIVWSMFDLGQRCSSRFVLIVVQGETLHYRQGTGSTKTNDADGATTPWRRQCDNRTHVCW